jgi:hypothetical protein
LSLQDTLTAALVAAVPLTDTKALEVAKATLPLTEFLDFAKWFEVNGKRLVARLNS